MKKFLSMLLVLCMALGMVACGGLDNPVAETDSTATSEFVPSPEGDGSLPYGSGFVLNVDAKVYHLPGCDITTEIQNVAFFDAEIEDMEALGFVPCSTCKPDTPLDGEAVG